MPVRVITGNPRNGKTLLFMQELMEAVRKAERPVFHAGVDGIQPGLGHALPDPTKWNARNADGSYVVPDGSIIFVDEAWKWFGHLQNASSSRFTPPHVIDMAEHGHRGLDFVFTTQMPVQIYPFLRGMMQEHTHVVRRYGMQLADLYTWQELNEDVKSKTMREGASHKLWPYPKNLFGAYKSASEHTVKRKIPMKALMLPLLVLGIVGLIAYTFVRLRHPGGARVSASSAVGVASDASDSSGQPKGPKWRTTLDYIDAHRPRIESMPWTAPVFDGREVTVDPHLYCMASGAGLDAQGVHSPEACSCVTEQGTLYELDGDQCRALARRGEHYDPYKRDVAAFGRAAPLPGGGQRPPAMAAPAAAPVRGGGRSASQVASYGNLDAGP
jgi:hypothetical protein